MQLDQSKRREAAIRCASIAFVVIFVVGLALIGYEFYSGRAPLDSPSAKTTTTDTTETKTTATGQTETTKKREIATTSEDFVGRTLGKTGPWFLRILLVVLAAFLTGAVVQRVILGKYAFEFAGLKVPDVSEIAPQNTEKLPPLPELVTKAFAFDAPDPLSATDVANQKKISLTSTYVKDLLTEITGIGPTDFAIVDLGAGRSWLTTRLFIVAILLKRMRSLKTFVFVETRDGIDKKFIGDVAPDVVRWALARAYPWLEDAYASAYSQLPNRRILSESGALDPIDAGFLVQYFIANIQSTALGDAGEWVELAPGKWEHGHWISRGLLERLVEVSPIRSSVVDAADLTPQERVLKVLAREGSFVALIDDKGRFMSLVDRTALLERTAARLTSASTMH
jgi:hypothetical protein